MTMLWRSQSIVCTRRRSSNPGACGTRQRRWRSQYWSGSTGGTPLDFTSPWPTGPRPRSKLLAPRSRRPHPWCPSLGTKPKALQFSQGKISHHKIPRYVHVVEELPMTVTGKVRKMEMREEALKLLDLERRTHRPCHVYVNECHGITKYLRTRREGRRQ